MTTERPAPHPSAQAPCDNTRRVVLSLAGTLLVPGGGTRAAQRDTRTVIALGKPANSQLSTLDPGQRQRFERGELESVDIEWSLEEAFSLSGKETPDTTEFVRSDKLGKLRYAQAGRSFDIEQVLGGTGKLKPVSANAREVCAWELLSNPMAGTQIQSPATRDKLYGIAARLHKLGWRRFIPLDQPRLQAMPSLIYKLMFRDDPCPLDPDWVPDPDTWRQIAGAHPCWHWVADQAHLQLTLTDLQVFGPAQPRKPTEVSDKDLYVLRWNIRSLAGYLGIARWPPERAREQLAEWRRDTLPQARQSRANAESGMRRQGWRIFETYRDPPIPQIL